MSANESYRSIYQELLEIEKAYRALQNRAEYLITKLRDGENSSHVVERTKLVHIRRNSRHLPLEIYANEVKHLLKKHEKVSAQEIRRDLENRYRSDITNVYQMMERIMNLEPKIKKVGRGFYSYEASQPEGLTTTD